MFLLPVIQAKTNPSKNFYFMKNFQFEIELLLFTTTKPYEPLQFINNKETTRASQSTPKLT